MDVECIPYRKTGYFTNLITDYLDEKEHLSAFYNRFPRLEAFKDQIREKKVSFASGHRRVLTQALQRQYQGFDLSPKTVQHLEALEQSSTFTITTGHQLNLFTGPLYFLYKIISTINLCNELSETYKEYEFVPVYWMATEDHDFEEINYFNFKGQKIQWNKEISGAVGRTSTEDLKAVLQVLRSVSGNTKRAGELYDLFEKAYIDHNNLADATRYLANALFGDHGLVIIDGDDPELKKLLVPYIEKDLFDRVSFMEVSDTIDQWQSLSFPYGVQVNPREINYFYLKDELRERIIANDEGFYINNTDLSFSREEMLKEIEQFPERFSPNVITRPVYQEVILPNLCYIGGGGEIAYWLELKSSFDKYDLPFPILLLRNSALIISDKQHRKLKRLQLDIEDLFMNQNSFINKKIREISNINIDLSSQKNFLKEHFEELYKTAELTDPSFLGAVKAQEIKQIKGIDHLEKRLLKAQKRKLRDHVIRMTELQNQLFPNQSLQERNLNFSEIYLEHGPDFITGLMDLLKPLDMQFAVVKIGAE